MTALNILKAASMLASTDLVNVQVPNPRKHQFYKLYR